MTKTQYQKILLIEDDPGDARLVREALRETGSHDIELSHCNSLADALNHLQQQSTDLILLDLGLPDATGLAALPEIDRVSPRTPVIILTGLDDDAAAVDALRAGAQDHLLKGRFTGDSLLRSARYALERQRTFNLRSGLLEGIARQLKTPVDAILTSVQLLREASPTTLTERQSQMLERTFNTAETLHRFHEGMLDLARADEGPLRYQINGFGGACVIAEIKRRMAKALASIQGEGAAEVHAFAEQTLADAADGVAAATNAAAPIRVLVLEDNPGDARLVQEILAEADLQVEVETSANLSDTVRRLEEASYDVVLVDLGLPDASALEAVSEVTRLAPRASIIVLTGTDDDHTAAEALKKGAQDYLIKGQVDADVLVRSIRFARERQRTVNLRAELLEAIAHELRNPVHVVLGYAHLLLEKVPDPLTPEQAQTLGNVLATTRTLRRLSEAMLELAGADKGPQRAELLNADATEVVNEIKRRMAHLVAIGADHDAIPYRMPQATAAGKPVGAGRLFRRMLRRLRKQPKHVLVIDPDYDSRTIIRTALESGAFDVVEATDESDVLSHLVSDKIGLAVFERQTPHLTSPEVFDEVCKVAAFFDVPMLFLDEHSNGNGNGIGNGNKPLSEHRISKPFTPEQLLFAVDHVMGRA